MRLLIFRYNPESEARGSLREYRIDAVEPGEMLLEALLRIKERDETLAFRHSCGTGLCGADAVNVNGRNVLACVTRLGGLRQPVVVRPLPGMRVLRDLVVDMDPFLAHYRAVRPYLMSAAPEPEAEHRQSPAERGALDGLFECVLCGCCNAACPAYRSGRGEFLGPAALLQAWRFLSDSRDTATQDRLSLLEGPRALFACRSIGECVHACPRHLNPVRAIGSIRRKMLDLAT